MRFCSCLLLTALLSGEWADDADGHILTQTTPNGAELESTWDVLNRRTDLSISGARPGEVSATHWRYDGNANVLAIEEGLRTESRSYDAFDRLEHVQNVQGQTLDYGYDAVGNRTRLTRSGAETMWVYDALNRNTSVTVPGQGSTQLDYYPSGKPKTVTRPDGSVSQTTYDEAGRIATITHSKAGTPIATLSYRYDLNGNRREQKETNGAVTGNVEQVTTYVYDKADRLTELHEAGANARDTVYILDGVGNRTDETVTDATHQTISHSTLTYNARDQLTQRDDTVANVHVVQAYDGDGNLASQSVNNGPVRVFTYDARDRMVTLAQPGAPPLGFDYDPAGLRLRKTQGAAETRYLYQRSLQTDPLTLIRN